MSNIDATAGVANTAIARGREPRVIARFAAYSPVTATGVSPSWGSNGNAAAGSSSGGRVGPGGVTLGLLMQLVPGSPHPPLVPQHLPAPAPPPTPAPTTRSARPRPRPCGPADRAGSRLTMARPAHRPV